MSSQSLMKELITELATHYNLSEKQVAVMSESLFFDSFSKTELEAQMADLLKTPAAQPCPELEVEELSSLLTPCSCNSPPSPSQSRTHL